MWKKLKNTEYYIDFNENLDIAVTDYVGIWFTHFSPASFLSCLQESNLGLEIDTIELEQNGKQMLRNPECLKNIKFLKDYGTLLVNMSWFCGYPLKLTLKLTEASREMFFQKVTLLLLRTIEDLHSSQCELRQMLHKKDKEIDEYKFEGGRIRFPGPPYDDKSHMNNHKMYSEVFNSTDIKVVMSKIIEDVPEMKAIKQEIVEPSCTPSAPEQSNVKTDPECQVKQEMFKMEPKIKMETLTEIHSASTLQVSGVSPKKKTRKMLNL